MSEQIITVSDSLWLVRELVHPEFDDGLFYIRDDTGGNTLIGLDEIPALIEALNTIGAMKWEAPI